MDRVAVETEALRPMYGAMWERLEEKAPIKRGWSEPSAEHFFARFDPTTKADHPATREEHITPLTGAGFTTACVHMHLNRAVFAAVKAE